MFYSKGKINIKLKKNDETQRMNDVFILISNVWNSCVHPAVAGDVVVVDFYDYRAYAKYLNLHKQIMRWTTVYRR